MLSRASLTKRLQLVLSENKLKDLSNHNLTLRQLAEVSDEEFAGYEAYVQQLRREKRWKDASDLLFFLLFLDPNSLSCWICYGQVELEHGSPEVALGAFQAVLARDPTKKPSAYFKAAECCLKLKQPLAGLYYLELFKAIFPHQEERQIYAHQLKLLDEECERELKLHPPKEDHNAT